MYGESRYEHSRATLCNPSPVSISACGSSAFAWPSPCCSVAQWIAVPVACRRVQGSNFAADRSWRFERGLPNSGVPCDIRVEIGDDDGQLPVSLVKRPMRTPTRSGVESGDFNRATSRAVHFALCSKIKKLQDDCSRLWPVLHRSTAKCTPFSHKLGSHKIPIFSNRSAPLSPPPAMKSQTTMFDASFLQVSPRSVGN